MPCATTSGLPLLNCCGPSLPPGRYHAEQSFPKHGFGSNVAFAPFLQFAIALPEAATRYLRFTGVVTNYRDTGADKSGEIVGNYLTGDAVLNGDNFWDNWFSDFNNVSTQDGSGNVIEYDATHLIYEALWVSGHPCTFTLELSDPVDDDLVEAECRRLLALKPWVLAIPPAKQFADTEWVVNNIGASPYAYATNGCRNSDGVYMNRYQFVDTIPPVFNYGCVRQEVLGATPATTYFPINCVPSCILEAPPRNPDYEIIEYPAPDPDVVSSVVKQTLIDVCPP